MALSSDQRHLALGFSSPTLQTDILHVSAWLRIAKMVCRMFAIDFWDSSLPIKEVVWCQFPELWQDVDFWMALHCPHGCGRERGCNSPTPSVQGVQESLAVDRWRNATAFVVYVLHDPILFTAGCTIAHAVHTNTSDEVSYLSGVERTVRALRIFIVKRVCHSVFDLETSLLKPSLCHWPSWA
jgi:hypothetical protein